jgi:hypothetical protein
MSTKNDPEENVICSFCGKKPKDIEVMIAGGGDLAICNECVQLCVAVIENKKAGETPFFRIPGEKYRQPRGELRPITRMPKGWRVQDTELYATEPYVTACSPDGKRHANFAVPKPLAWWMLCNDKQVDVDKLREEITQHLHYVIRETLIKY